MKSIGAQRRTRRFGAYLAALLQRNRLRALQQVLVADLRKVRTESVGTEAADESLDDDKEVRTIIDALKLRPKLEKRFERILGRYIHDMRGAIARLAECCLRPARPFALSARILCAARTFGPRSL